MTTAEAWKKNAQSGLDKLAVDHKALSSGGSDRLSEYWQSLSSETKNTLINSILGGVVGGGAMGAMGALAAPEGQGLHKGVNSAVMGAILGALTGGAGTAAYNAVSSGRQLPGEVSGHRAIGDTMADKIVGTAWRNPALTAGTLLGGWQSGKGVLSLRDALNTLENARRQLHRTNRGARLSLVTHAFNREGFNPARIMALPAGVGLGYLADRYIKGDYE